MLLDAAGSLLLIVDVQERLAPAIPESRAVAERIAFMLRAARLMEVPVLATEQYPAGLGGTVEPLAGLLDPAETYEKIHFCAAAEPAFMERLSRHGRRRVVVCGTEAHVCVLQTTLGLVEAGVECCVVADGVASRVALNRDAAIDRMRVHGVEVVTSEMVVFEWLRRAGTAVFKEALKLIR